MTTKFSSKKDSLYNAVVWGTNALLLGICIVVALDKGITTALLAPIGIIASVIFLLLWMFYGTSYSLSPQVFSYQMGPISGKIETENIKEIIVGETLWAGLKLATAKNGLIRL